MSYELGKSTPVKIYRGKWTDGTKADDPDQFVVDQTYDGRVGVSVDGKVFGLVDDWHLPYNLASARLSHMSYYCDGDNFDAAESLAWMRSPGHRGIWLFNGGGMGMSALWATADDMERAFRELGLL